MMGLRAGEREGGSFEFWVYVWASAWCELGLVVSGFCDLDMIGV